MPEIIPTGLMLSVGGYAYRVLNFVVDTTKSKKLSGFKIRSANFEMDGYLVSGSIPTAFLILWCVPQN